VIEIARYWLPSCRPIAFVLCVFKCRLQPLAADSCRLTVVYDAKLILFRHGLSFLLSDFFCGVYLFSSCERIFILRVFILLLILADFLCLDFAPWRGQTCLGICSLMMLLWLSHKGG
jgi:hypothetical protein